MKISKSKLGAGVVVGACVAACAAPGLLSVLALGGLATVTTALACSPIVEYGMLALIGIGSVTYLFMRQRKMGSRNADAFQCRPENEGRSGCGCKPSQNLGI